MNLSFFINFYILILFINLLLALVFAIKVIGNEKLDAYMKERSNVKFKKSSSLKDIIISYCPIFHLVYTVMYLIIVFSNADKAIKILSSYHYYVLGEDQH